MTKFRKTATSAAALSLCLTGSAAFADLSAQEVWEDWKGYMQGFGYAMEGSESMDGNVLTIRDLSMSMELPDGAGTMEMGLSAFMFTDNGDGSVTMTLPPVMPVTINVDAPGDSEDVNMTVDYITSDFAMVATGDTSSLNYEYGADELTLELKDLVVAGETVDIGTAMMSMADLTGSSAIKIGNLRNIVQTIKTGTVTYDVNITDPEGAGKFVMNGSLAGMGFEGAGDYPTEMNTSDVNAMLEAGFGFEGGFTHSGSQFSLDFEEGRDKMMVNSTSESGGIAVGMDAGKLLYDVSSMGLNMTVQGADIPFPVELGMAETGFKLLMPIAQSEGEQDFAMGITLSDFTMSDMIWGMVDPSGQLPRDPATIAMDVSGKAKLFFDIMDPEQMEAVDRGEMMPGELNSLAINALTVRAAGAELTGTGDFTFDNSDLTTFDGMPAPDGAIDLSLTGANGLMDKLVAMGLLPEEQAMGARMMMGLFAVPGEGEDSLTSKIEVKSDGQILANGQRIQ